MVSKGMMTTGPTWRRLGLSGLLLVAAGAALMACDPVVDHRGYLPRAEDLQKVQVGMSKSEVAAALGSPSTTATVNFEGDSYYYISSVVQERGFLEPKEIDRKVFAVRFNQADQVESFAQYGLEDGRIIDFSGRTTPTRGREFTILQQLFSNLGRFTPNDTPPLPGPVRQ
jgi:outer membrane protein assembly factor BamE (lipoprotein component of BamABCDE complex)